MLRNMPLGVYATEDCLLQTGGDRGSERVRAGEQRERRAGVRRSQGHQNPDLEQEPGSQAGGQTQ